MRVEIKLFAGLDKIAGKKKMELNFDPDSIKMHELIVKLIKIIGVKFENIIFRDIANNEREEFKRYGKELEIREIIFAINGKMTSYNGDIELRDGDIVALFPPLGGG